VVVLPGRRVNLQAAPTIICLCITYVS
jgi:hypothetical protein